MNSEITKKILKILETHYGNVGSFLVHKNEFEFLIAVILSAQTTDALVNRVTPNLFAKYKTAKDLKNANLEDVINLIRQVNYHKNKSKFLIATSKLIDEEFNGQMPNNMEDLIKLPGVGRKVANVILADHFNQVAGIVVDTHIKRVSKRIGWTISSNPTQIERDLIKIWPEEYFIPTPKRLILIGREFCFPKKPDCEHCPINKYCKKLI